MERNKYTLINKIFNNVIRIPLIIQFLLKQKLKIQETTITGTLIINLIEVPIITIVITTMVILLYGCNINNMDTSNNTVFDKAKTENPGNYHAVNLDDRLNIGVHKKLSFYDTKINKKIANIDINKNATFSISFIHSVNKTNITDYYYFDNKNNIILDKTNYKSFGAGVPTEINNNETFKKENNGSYTIENINKNIGTITLYLSDIYEHTLKINKDREYHLWDLIGKNKIIEIKIENW